MHIWFLAQLEELLVESIRVVVSPCEVALLSLCACLCGCQPWYDFLFVLVFLMLGEVFSFGSCECSSV